MNAVNIGCYVNLESFPQCDKNTTIELIKSLFGLSQHTKQMTFFATVLETHFPFTESEITHYTKQAEEIRQQLMVSVLEVRQLSFIRANSLLDSLIIYRFLLLSLLQDLLGDNGVFIYPTFRNQVFPQLMLCEIMSSNCGFFNIIGFPAVHVPMGLNCERMPLGVQVNFN